MARLGLTQHLLSNLQFVSDNSVFYKSPRMRELDVVLGDTQCDIIGREPLICEPLVTKPCPTPSWAANTPLTVVYHFSASTEDMEQSIAIDLQASILQHAPMLIEATRLVANLDCLLALALCARVGRRTRREIMTLGQRISAGSST